MDTKLRALVVEDDYGWQQILTEILQDMGLEVDIASRQEDAAQIIRRRSYRLAVLDLSLGGTDHHNQDGLAVAEIIRRFNPGCAILFLSGFATVELAVKVMREMNSFTCLRKEVFRRAEFRAIVREALETPGLADEPEPSDTPTASSRDEDGQERTLLTALVVEDDAGWRSLLNELLDDSGYKATHSSSFVEAIGLLQRAKPSVAVVDLALASSLDRDNLDGYRLLTNMRRAGVPVIVVSGYADPARIEQAYADGYIIACLEKQAFERKSFRQALMTAQAGVLEDAVWLTLTEREREVLGLIARGMTNKEIAAALTISSNTVKRHLKSLFGKLQVNTRSAASAKAITMREEKAKGTGWSSEAR